MAERRKTLEQLRSQRWLGGDSVRAFNHRTRLRELGFTPDDFGDKPVIGILNTWSEMNSCHSHFPDRVQHVKRGVHQAGGFPVELPAMSLSEIMVKPTTMLYRNFLAMEVEELIRSHPLDGVVLMGGSDKTTPGLLLGAISAAVPAIFVPAGPMLRGYWRGRTLGSGTDVWASYADYRAGKLDADTLEDMVAGLALSAGTCMTMGTAATMMSLAETLGFTLPGASSIPAVDANHQVMCAGSGRRIVVMVWEDLKPSDILSPASFDNAITVDMAVGGSTNAIIHVIALARRAGIALGLSDFDEISRTTPVIADIRPSGRFLMEDFFYAGGLPALLTRLRDRLALDALTVTGASLGANIEPARVYNEDVIHGLDDPIYREGGTAVLSGNLAPDGCVMKPSAAEPRLLKHTGPALVFRDYNHMAAEIERDDLDVTPDTVLVLQGAGPKGGPGMPEWGMLPIPRKLVQQGVRDMLRISDARMSGTSYGACILHVAPESHVGGPLALVQTGDLVEVDVAHRRLHLHVSEEELNRRRAAWRPPRPKYTRGYGWMFLEHITQANEGCDFDYLQLRLKVAEPEIH